MEVIVMNNNALVNFDIPTPVRLSLLWATLMSLYIYNDYFSLYLPGEIESLSAGDMGSLGPATASILIFTSLMMAIPTVMIFLSAFLPPIASRWSNIVVGAAYTFIQFWSFSDSPPFYVIVVALEIIVTGLIILTAWRWPRR
jgi:uncharacterized membrane protein (UPF0182 family)